MKFKKNQSGMTLVEVVISLAMFASMFLGATMCFAAALKLTNRNMLRDKELNVQQKVIEEHQVQGVALVSGHSLGSDNITFGTSGAFNMATGTGTLDNVTQFHAIKTADHGDDYNFEIKGLASSRNPLGNAAGDYDKAGGKYCLHVINDTTQNIDVIISMTSGYIYEGNFSQGYKNSSSLYSRTVPGKGAGAVDAGALPAELQVGYYNPGTIGSGDLVISWTLANGVTGQETVNGGNLSANGRINIKISDSGKSIVYDTP